MLHKCISIELCNCLPLLAPHQLTLLQCVMHCPAFLNSVEPFDAHCSLIQIHKCPISISRALYIVTVQSKHSTLQPRMWHMTRSITGIDRHPPPTSVCELRRRCLDCTMVCFPSTSLTFVPRATPRYTHASLSFSLPLPLSLALSPPFCVSFCLWRSNGEVHHVDSSRLEVDQILWKSIKVNWKELYGEHLQLPNFSGQAWASMGKSSRCIGHSAWIVNLCGQRTRDLTSAFVFAIQIFF